MKKTIFSLLVIGLVLITLTGCVKDKGEKDSQTETKITEDSKRFKEDYESINGTTNNLGSEHRSIIINEINPLIFSTAEEILEKIDNRETFYVYFGSKYCPWCRSVIEKVIEVANEQGVEKIYYVDVWGEEHEEILRDVYELDSKGKTTLKSEGTASYYTLLERLDNVLIDYNLTNSEGQKVSTGEKRIMLPNFIYIENGKAINLVTGISNNQTGSRDELTDEMLKDEENIFKEFFRR